MVRPDAPLECCRHDRAPLRRLGIVTHQRGGRRVYVLVCTECGFAVTTEELRRLRRPRRRRRHRAAAEPLAWVPHWAPLLP